MSITIKDCLKLPSLSLGQVIAGHGGLNSIVNTISVVEFDTFDDGFLVNNELLISALFSAKDDVQMQCAAIKDYKQSGDVGLILFYSDLILNGISPKLIETADHLDFPIILLPGEDMGMKYSDVISDVMEAVILDRKAESSFVNNTMERISQLPSSDRTISRVLSFASDYIRSTFFLCDENLNLIASSFWPHINSIDFAKIVDAFNRDDDSYGNIFKTDFSIKATTKLTLFSVSKNDKLNSTLLQQTAEIVQLFAVIWNYNLNLATKESIIPALIEGENPLITHIAKTQQLNLADFDALAIFEINSDNHDLRNNILDSIREIARNDHRNFVADAFSDSIILLYSYSSISPRDKIFSEEIVKCFHHVEQPFSYAFFNNLNLISDVRNMYLKYHKGIHFVKKIYPLKNGFSPSEIEFANRCAVIMESVDGTKEAFLKIIQPLCDDSEADLVKTAITYLIDSNAQVKQASQLLFVHRNTIQYRLSRIKVLLECDITKMPESYDIYTALAIYRLTTGNL
ncbi:DNA-binding PucR family transcriptional regulator [Clostridiales Family XIII bacterium PM5-7]